MTSPPGGEFDLTDPGQQRSREQDRRADSRTQRRIERAALDRLGVDLQRIASGPVGLSTGGAHEFDECLDIADARDVFERHRPVREERSGHDGQRGILVAAWADRSREGRLPSTMNWRLDTARCARVRDWSGWHQRMPKDDNAHGLRATTLTHSPPLYPPYRPTRSPIN